MGNVGGDGEYLLNVLESNHQKPLVLSMVKHEDRAGFLMDMIRIEGAYDWGCNHQCVLWIYQLYMNWDPQI